MSTIVKIIEIVTESDKSWEDAAQNAVTEASKTVDNITGIDVIGFKGEVKNGNVVKYKAHCKVAFVVKNS
ncbi:MAG: dodecin domain-containing protein [Spirochaetales bacterium]|nr:dodecin domain-containing protein [Spirochaetales bacterium]